MDRNKITRATDCISVEYRIGVVPCSRTYERYLLIHYLIETIKSMMWLPSLIMLL